MNVNDAKHHTNNGLKRPVARTFEATATLK